MSGTEPGYLRAVGGPSLTEAIRGRRIATPWRRLDRRRRSVRRRRGAKVAAHYRECLAAGASIVYEEGSAAGGQRWWQTSLTPIRDRAGTIVQLLASHRHHPIAKLASAVVVAREEAGGRVSRLLDAIERFGEAVAIFDADDRLVLCNARYREINAFSRVLVPASASRRCCAAASVARPVPDAIGAERRGWAAAWRACQGQWQLRAADDRRQLLQVGRGSARRTAAS